MRGLVSKSVAPQVADGEGEATIVVKREKKQPQQSPAYMRTLPAANKEAIQFSKAALDSVCSEPRPIPTCSTVLLALQWIPHYHLPAPVPSPNDKG